jgi:hypothetical protein
VDDLSIVNRPASLAELSIVFDLTTDRLERLAERPGIRPACRIGRTRCYGPKEIRRFYDALLEGATAC